MLQSAPLTAPIYLNMNIMRIIVLLVLSLTCIGWYPATDDTNTTFPPLKRKKNKNRCIKYTVGRFYSVLGPFFPPNDLSLTPSSPYEAPPT